MEWQSAFFKQWAQRFQDASEAAEGTAMAIFQIGDPGQDYGNSHCNDHHFRNSSDELDRMLSQLNDVDFLKWCKEIVELIEDSRSQEYHTLAILKAIVDRRVEASSSEGIISQALEASWYQNQLLPASRKRDDAARIIQRHRTICCNNWGPSVSLPGSTIS
jgi:hypothetical protein